MTKKGYFEYDPMIYPRMLWVYIGSDFNEMASSSFGGIILPDEKYCGVTYDKVIRKSDKKYGVLVSFPSKKDMTMENISHESSHVVDAIENAIGMEHGGEPSAYLFGWVVSCINKARLGKGNFVVVSDGKKVDVQKQESKEDDFEKGKIVAFSFENGHRFIGCYQGEKDGNVCLSPCIERNAKPDGQWMLIVNGKKELVRMMFVKSAILKFGYANDEELKIYSEVMDKYDNAFKK